MLWLCLRVHLSMLPWEGEQWWPLCSNCLKQTLMNDYVHRDWQKTAPSWAESSLHRRVISEPFCESLQVSRRSAARMHFWNSCLKIWGKLGWKNNHMILQPLEYFWLSSTKSNVTWQPYTIKTSPLTNRATRHHDGQTKRRRKMCSHVSLSFFILIQRFLSFNNSDEREDSHGDFGCHAGQHGGCERAAPSVREHRAHFVPWQTHGHSQLQVFKKFGWMCLLHL